MGQIILFSNYLYLIGILGITVWAKKLNYTNINRQYTRFHKLKE